MKILKNTFRRGVYFFINLVYNKIEVFKMKRLIKKKYSKETLQKICDFVVNKNKYNFKTAAIDKDTVRSIYRRVENLVDHNEPESVLEIKNILKDQCPDCIYSGTAYRKFILQPNLFDTLDKTTLNNKTYFKVNDVNELIHGRIQTGSEQSCSKDLEACKNFEAEEDGIEVIIKFEGSDGIDIMKVCEFYRNICEELYDKSEDEFYETLIDQFELVITEYEKEKEVLINVSSEYEICCINNNPYFENEEYVLVNNILPDYIEEEKNDGEEEYYDQQYEHEYDDDDDYF